MKKYVLIVAIAALVFGIIACSKSTSSPQVNTPSDENTTIDIQPTTSQPTEVPNLGTTRSNPAPVGSEVIADKMSFTVTDMVRPANDIVIAGNQFNSLPEDGKEYIFVELNVVCQKSSDEKCSFTPVLNLNLIGSNGIEYDPEIFIAGVNNLLESTEFYGGASIKGYIPFIVGVGETDLVLLYEPLLGDTFYLALP